jgi:transposase
VQLLPQAVWTFRTGNAETVEARGTQRLKTLQTKECSTVIPSELEDKILRLHRAEKWLPNTIATQLEIHHSTVRRVLNRAGVLAPGKRASRLDPFMPLIREVLAAYPNLRATRIYTMLQERGYQGGADHVRHVISTMRPRRAAEAFQRLRTLPGEQAQVDWGHFGHLTVGRAKRPLMGFVMVLSYSRAIFLRFYPDARMSSFLHGHQAAFDAFGGVARVLLYDNLKSAVLERHRDIVRLHPTLRAFAGHHCFEPRPVGVARGNEKGRVERAIQYIRHAFFAAREYESLDDLNAQADAWCTGPAMQRRCPEDRSVSVQGALDLERPRLIQLPDNPFAVDERLEVHVGKTPYARFDLNDYSVPHTHVGRTLVVHASLHEVRISEGDTLLCTHSRSYGKGDQVEDAEHIAKLRQEKAKARQQGATDRLLRAAPLTRDLLQHIAEGNGNLMASIGSLARMLDDYGAAELESALGIAIEKGTCHVHGVRHVLEHRARERGAAPVLSVTLPDDPRVRNAAVVPHRLDSYHGLGTPEAKETR